MEREKDTKCSANIQTLWKFDNTCWTFLLIVTSNFYLSSIEYVLYELDLYPQPVFIVYWVSFLMFIQKFDKNWLGKRRPYVSLLDKLNMFGFFGEQITEAVSIWACYKLCGHSDQTQPSQADTKLSDLVLFSFMEIWSTFTGSNIDIKINKYIQIKLKKTVCFVLYLIFKIVKIASKNCQTFYNFEIELRSPVASVQCSVILALFARSTGVCCSLLNCLIINIISQINFGPSYRTSSQA